MFREKLFVGSLLLWTVLGNSTSVMGGVLSFWLSASSLENTTIEAVNLESGVTGKALSAGSGLTAATGSTFNWRGWDVASVSAADAMAASDFFQWGVEVTGAVDVDISGLDIRFDRSGAGPDDVDIWVSVNGGATESVLTHDFTDNSLAVSFNQDLSALSALQSLQQGDVVDFFLLGFNSETSSGTFDIENNTSFMNDAGIELRGMVTVVPEPQIPIVLLGGLLIGVAVQRRIKSWTVLKS